VSIIQSCFWAYENESYGIANVYGHLFSSLIFFFLLFTYSIETALAPAAADGLGWGTVETSGVLGSTSIVIAFVMIFVMVATKYISDIILVGVGAILWVIGGFGIYLGWTRDAPVWNYVVPVMVAVAGFPFIAASNRSTYSKSVASKPELESMQASMQAILSMAASVAGFV
jgi:hypothetical protein